MSRQRSGFTLIEILTVMAIMAVMAMLVLPKFGNMNDRNQMRSARDGLVARLASARAAAIATGRPATFELTGNNVTVWLRTPNRVEKKGMAIDLFNQFGTRNVGGNASVTFDGRGIGVSAATKVYLQRGTVKDSLCISKLGLVHRHGCAQ
jgi:prepilin-type N-terminal cleavage/methylation domain-containing protein